MASGGIQGQLANIMEAFAKNSRIMDVQKKFFLKLLGTKGGRAALAFHIWKELPIIQDPYLVKLANKFERGLGGFAHRLMRETLNPFKDILVDGETAKKRCVQKLINTTMSGNKRMYLAWSAIAKRDNVVNSCKLTADLFETSLSVLNGNMSMIFQNVHETKLKEDCLHKLFKNLHMNYVSCYNKWKDISIQFKLKNLLN